MLERIVESWLTSTTELGYQAAFTQLLAHEGYKVLHAPVHHPYEHGKDLAAVSPSGELYGFQLKSGNIGLSELDAIQGQLFALAGSAIAYPGVEPPRSPDRAVLVTTGDLTPPARDRLRSLNDANRERGFVPIETVERDQLVGRFIAAHEAYLPVDLNELNALLRLVLEDGLGPFPVRAFSEMLWGLVLPDPDTATAKQVGRNLPGAAIVTSYVAGPWERTENHLGVAEAWLVLAFCTLRVAELLNLPEELWASSYEIARDAARQALGALLREAADAEDLVVPDLVEGLIYPSRAAVVAGYMSALCLSEMALGSHQSVAEDVRALITREAEFIKVAGEAAVPLLLMTATALEVLGDPVQGCKLAINVARGLAVANAPDSSIAVADPYHSVEDVLVLSLGGESNLEDERFAGQAYTLHVMIEWLARRELRIPIADIWPQVTRIHFAEYRPDQPVGLLGHHDDAGIHHTWAPAAPASWKALREDASVVQEAELPERLWQRIEMLPYLPLLYPQRLTSAVAKALDYMTTGRCEVHLVDEDVQEGSPPPEETP